MIMNKFALSSTLLLAIACAPQKNEKRYSVAEPEKSKYIAEHRMVVNFDNVGPEAFNLNQFVDGILKELVQVKLATFYWNVEPEGWTELNMATNPFIEKEAINKYNEVINKIQAEITHQDNPIIKVELEMLIDFITNQMKYEDSKIKNNNIDLHASIVYPFYTAYFIDRLKDKETKDKFRLDYLKSLNESSEYTDFISYLDKIAAKKTLYVSEEGLLKIDEALVDADLYATGFCNQITPSSIIKLPSWDELMGEESDEQEEEVEELSPIEKECNAFKPKFVSLLDKIQELRDAGKIQARKNYSKAQYEALLKLHGVYVKPDAMYAAAKKQLERTLPEYKALIAEIQGNDGLIEDENLIEHLRTHDSPTDDHELKARILEANSNISQIIQDNNLLTLPQEKQVVHFAGLVEGTWGNILQVQAEHGIPQMLPLLDGFEDQPFALWPMVSVMKEKTPDWLITPSLHSTSAHEGRPGHEMQFFKVQKSDFKSQIRHNLIQNTANVEGWALYAESIVEPYVTDKKQRLFYLQAYLMRMVRVITDYEYQLGLISFEEGVKKYQSYLGMSAATGNSEMTRRKDWPGRDTGYFMGRLAIEQLKERMQQKYLDTYSEKCFNDIVVDYSFSPAQFIERFINATDNCLTVVQ
jgi:hypothetical protein